MNVDHSERVDCVLAGRSTQHQYPTPLAGCSPPVRSVWTPQPLPAIPFGPKDRPGSEKTCRRWRRRACIWPVPPRRIESTWDLWPLAAETAKEPSAEETLSLAGLFPRCLEATPHVLLHNFTATSRGFRAIGSAAFFVGRIRTIDSRTTSPPLAEFDTMSTTEMTKPSHDRAAAKTPSQPPATRDAHAGVFDAQRPRRRSPAEAGRLDHRSDLLRLDVHVHRHAVGDRLHRRGAAARRVRPLRQSRRAGRRAEAGGARRRRGRGAVLPAAWRRSSAC